jgi:hypothetical protein
MNFKETTPIPADGENDEGASYLEICRDGTTTEWRVKGGVIICEGEVLGDSEASPSHLPDKSFVYAVSVLFLLCLITKTNNSFQN